jgi:hypothetical protein
LVDFFVNLLYSINEEKGDMKMRIAMVLSGFLLLSGVAQAEIKVSPSYVEQQLDTSVAHLMCPTVWMAQDAYLNGIFDPSCDYYDILAPRIKSYFKAGGRTYTIMQIGPPGNQRYWLVPYTVKEKRKKKRYWW